jgi:hypothetical protein
MLEKSLQQLFFPSNNLLNHKEIKITALELKYSAITPAKIEVCNWRHVDARHFAYPAPCIRDDLSVQKSHKILVFHNNILKLLFNAETNIISVFYALTGPPITHTSVQKSSQLLPKINNSDISKGPFVMRTPALTTYCQQLWVIAKMRTANKDGSIS